LACTVSGCIHALLARERCLGQHECTLMLLPCTLLNTPLIDQREVERRRECREARLPSRVVHRMVGVFHVGKRRPCGGREPVSCGFCPVADPAGRRHGAPPVGSVDRVRECVSVQTDHQCSAGLGRLIAVVRVCVCVMRAGQLIGEHIGLPRGQASRAIIVCRQWC
jgi:hypothetical protein